MKTGGKSLLAKVSCGLSIAALTLAFSFDGLDAVRAEEPELLTSSLQELIVAPIVRTVHGFEQRLTSLEVTVGAFADSFTSRRIVAQMLCVSDDSGAQTCITKAQLDSLLSSVAHAEVSPPSVTTEANAPAPTEPIEIVTTTDPAPSTPTAVDGGVLPPDREPEHTGALAATPAMIEQNLIAEDAVVSTEAGSRPSATGGEAITRPSEETVKMAKTLDSSPSDTSNVPDETDQDDHQSVQTGAIETAPSPDKLNMLPDAEIVTGTTIPADN